MEEDAKDLLRIRELCKDPQQGSLQPGYKSESFDSRYRAGSITLYKFVFIS